MVADQIESLVPDHQVESLVPDHQVEGLVPDEIEGLVRSDLELDGGSYRAC